MPRNLISRNALRPQPALPAPPTVYDRFLGIDRLRWLADELVLDRWESTHDSLSELTDPDDRAFATRIVTNQAAFPVEFWRKARPKVALTWYVLGEYQINSAWLVRGTGSAAQLPPARWQRFQELLRQAEDSLHRAISLDPSDPLPWAALLTSGKGLGVGVVELRRRFMEAEQAHHGSVHAHLDMVSALSRTWGGSDEEMFDFARWAHGTLPDGAAPTFALAAAHIERWVHLASFEPGGRPLADVYYDDPAVIAELNDVMSRSLWSSAYVESMHSIVERNYAVFGYALGNQFGPAQNLFAAIGNRFTTTPGSYYPQGPAAARARIQLGPPPA